MKATGRLLLALFALFFSTGVYAQSAGTGAGELVVGVKVAPPFVIRDGDHYTGLAVEAWETAAKAHGWHYRYKAFDLKGLLSAVSAHQIDAGLGAITATADREQTMDFSHTLASSGLGIAVRAQASAGWLSVARAVLSPTFLGVVATLAALLLVVGLITWLLERRRNPDQFGGPAAHGIGAGFWWAAVTMTTVGYGDKAPVTLGGRIVAVFWMFAALIVVSSFTAALTSALTVGQLSSRVQGAGDLPDVRVTTVGGTTSATWLKDHGIAYEAVASPTAALQSLVNGRADAVVFDAPLLGYLIRAHEQGKVRLLPQTLQRQDYVIALPQDSALREPLNESVLRQVNSPEWQERLKKLASISG